MKLFVTFGSWGEIAPLLEIALQLQARGESVALATTPDWSPRVRQYGVACHDFPAVAKYPSTLDAFLRAQLLGRMRTIYDVIDAAAPTEIIAGFYCFPAHVYADKHGIPFLATTTSAYYFMQTEVAPCFDEVRTEFMALRESLGLKHSRPFRVAGLYPWYLHTDSGPEPVGWPQLRQLTPLSKAVADFIQEPYGVVSRGTLVERGELDRMVHAIKAHGLKCLYLGPYECKADLSAYLDNHAEAVKGAKVVICHAGNGTIVECMGSPMVVDPVGYDQFYNANRLIDLKCAVGVKDSYIKAVADAMRPRSFLPNDFDLNDFLRVLNEHPPRDSGRPSADARQHSSVH